jgi:hypothetical protein
MKSGSEVGLINNEIDKCLTAMFQSHQADCSWNGLFNSYLGELTIVEMPSLALSDPKAVATRLIKWIWEYGPDCPESNAQPPLVRHCISDPLQAQSF